MNDMDFDQHLQQAAATVSTWPDWKQRVLGGPISSQPHDVLPDCNIKRQSTMNPEDLEDINELLNSITNTIEIDVCPEDEYEHEEIDHMAEEEFDDGSAPPTRFQPPKVKDDHDVADVLFQYLCDKYPDITITRNPTSSASGPKHVWVLHFRIRELSFKLDGHMFCFRTSNRGDWVEIDLNDPLAFTFIEFGIRVATTVV